MFIAWRGYKLPRSLIRGSLLLLVASRTLISEKPV